jgi:hypothetical protein
VNADGALIVFGEIENLVNGFEWIDVTRIGGIHFVDISRHEPTRAGMIGKRVAVFDAEVLDFEAADRRGHPAILIAMIVDAGKLADFPANRHAFEEIILEDEIAGVATFGEIDKFVE